MQGASVVAHAGVPYRVGEPPLTYAVGGWAWQRDVRGESVTVFELALSNVTGLDSPRAMSNMRYAAPRAVRVVLHEDSGDATLVSR